MSEDTHRLVIADPEALATAQPLTPAGLQVRRVLGADGDTATSPRPPSIEIGVYSYSREAGLREIATAAVHGATVRAGTTVLTKGGVEGEGAPFG